MTSAGDGAARLAATLRAAAAGDLGVSPTTDVPPELSDVAVAAGELLERVASEVRVARDAASDLARTLDSIRVAQERASADAARQGSGVEAASERLRLLSERAGEIAAAAEVIDEIAAQTNLLALNAAIESARADREESRGFTLFAQEVRKLSERSGGVARDVVALIGRLQEEVGSAAGAMDDLREGVRAAAQNATRSAGEVSELMRRGRLLEEALHRLRVPDPRAAAAAEELRQAKDAILRALEDLGTVPDRGEVAEILEDISAVVSRR